MQRSQFGPYRVVRLLGQGGMGTVYEAIDPVGGGTVAVKTLPVHLSGDDGIRRRFQSEIDTLMNLRHPGIARMVGFGDEDGLPFFAMEFVPGRTLEELLRSGRRFTWRETVAVALEIVPALKSAHDQGVVHRDLKPANLMFPPAAGGGFHVKLTDFGIAKLFGDTGHTRVGVVVGTPEYMAPEQATGLAIDHRADLYCLGLVMFAMLAGHPPFQGGVAEVVESQRSRRPPRLSTLAPDVPAPLDDLVERLLAKTAAARPASAVVVGRMLAEIASLRDAPRAASAGGPRPAGGTVADRGLPAVEPDALAPTLAAPRRPAVDQRQVDVQATTVADDTGRDERGDAGNGFDRSPTGRSTFTTVEAAARDARERRARADRRRSLLGTLAATATVATVLATGWWFLLRPWPWPDPNAEQRHYDRIIAMLGNPDDLGDPCREIRGFLGRHPDGAHAADVRRLGREVALDRLHKRSRHRFPTYTPKSPAERAYLEAIRLSSSDPRGATEKLRGMLSSAADKPASGEPGDDPCGIVERPDAGTWQELARRQLDILDQVVRREDAARRKEARDDASRAAAMLEQAVAYGHEIETTPDAARRVVAITRRHQVLEEIVEDYADVPAAAGTVAEARRLLDAH
jgi:serine/threonine-protein kinase